MNFYNRMLELIRVTDAGGSREEYQAAVWPISRAQLVRDIRAAREMGLNMQIAGLSEGFRWFWVSSPSEQIRQAVSYAALIEREGASGLARKLSDGAQMSMDL